MKCNFCGVDMQIKAVENSNQNVKFKANADMQAASTFVNMKDSQLKNLAYVSATQGDDHKKRRRSILATFYAIPVVSTIASGILPVKMTKEGEFLRLKNAALSERVGSAGRTAGSWAMILGIVGIYNGIKKAAVSDSKGYKKFNDNHPVLSFMADIGLILGGLNLATRGLGKVMNTSTVKNSKFLENLHGQKEVFKAWLDNSKMNKKIMPIITDAASKLAEEAPTTARITKGAIAGSALIAFTVGLIKMVKHSNKENQKIEQNYKALKDAQFKTAKHLTNALSIERNLLAQEQRDLAMENKELVKALQHKKHKHHHPEPTDDEKVIDK